MRKSIFIFLLFTLGGIAGYYMTNPAHILPTTSPNSPNTSSSFVEEQLKQGKKPNRLIHEKSPYLLQHAFNPVDWYPWGEEAFEKARKEDKPIFLSVGYSTCYWCHVMEREVFEDTAISRLMNERLVCIKVDREERPDVDRVYMTAVQAITGSGGWPMSVFMTPDRKPFYGATYIPPKAQHGRPGFPDLVERIDELWHHERTKLVESGDQITEMLQSHLSSGNSGALTEDALQKAYTQFLQAFDTVYAGFGNGPKFPRPVGLNFLLRYHSRHSRSGAPEQEHYPALEMTLSTLHAMADGGMHDHIGGGFHRYSVDEQWRVPHFEKMLYDQAQLALSYLEAYQVTHDEQFSRVAQDILNYSLRNLHDSHGGFYSAEDAESALDAANPEDKEEGAFYVWTMPEISGCLGKEQANIFAYAYGVTDTGNAFHDPLHVFTGKNILYAAHTPDEAASKFSKPAGEIREILSEGRRKLFAEREKRPRPHLDDKIITAWNGLMISALARASQVMEKKEYLDAAARAAQFIESSLYNSATGILYRRYRDGDARFEGGLQDYAFLVQGYLDLYEAGFDTHWLDRAIDLTTKQIALFQDTANGGFFDISGNDKSILMRTKEDYDGAEPTGNSVASLNLLRLSLFTDNRAWRDMAEKTIQTFGNRLTQYPEAAPQMLVALEWTLSAPREIVIVGNLASNDTQALLKEAHRQFIPDKIILLLENEASRRRFSELLPFTSGMKEIEGKATIYVCENYACSLPTTDPANARKLLSGARILN